MTEPWLRGTLTEFDAVRRQVLHALEHAREDVDRWCGGLTDAQMNARPGGVAPVAFHLRHIARSLCRLLLYAEERRLTKAQLADLETELDEGAIAEEVLNEVRDSLRIAMRWVKRFDPKQYEEVRTVGREDLPTTVGGLLIHCAEHTQRHVGQAITTAQIVTFGA